MRSLISCYAMFILSLAGNVACQQHAQCPLGQYTKPAPTPETGMKACKQYSCSSCCTSNLTEELAVVPLKVVGGMDYNQCGGLSSICSQYMAYMQCFYQCSPNLSPWLTQVGRLDRMPLCGSFCDEWFHACMYDHTCVRGTSWAGNNGYQMVDDPNNPTKKVLECWPGEPCRNFSEIYHDGQHFCTEMWPGSVVYEQDESKCMNPAAQDQASNEAVYAAAAGSSHEYVTCAEVTYIDTGAVIGIVIGCLAALTLICGGIVYFYRNKQNPKEKTVTTTAPKDAARAEELQEMNPSSHPTLE